MKKWLWVLALVTAGLLAKNSFALEDCSGKTGSEAASCWSGREAELRRLIAASQGQQKTLTETINYLSNKIYLTQAEIYNKEEELKVLEENIATLSVKISRLDVDLNETSELLINRVGEAYKRNAFNPSIYLMSSDGLTGYLTRMKYLQLAQENDQKVLLDLQNARDDNQKQKSLKEEAQAKVEALRQDLARQKATLNNQNLEKQRLLEATRNDEKRYQSLLSEAQAQKSAFSRFVSSLGGASILSNQTKCDGWGCYYNQRDGQWGNNFIGASDSTMREYGCLVTSMAMIASHYGKNLTPGQIAASSTPFFGNTALMWQGTWSVNGVSMTRTRIGSSAGAIDQELDAGRPVVVGIYGGPDHFLVIKKKENGEYIMHDPFPAGAADVEFTSRYPLSAISSVDKVSVN